MNTTLEKSLAIVFARIEDAGKGNSQAQKDLAEIFTTGQIIPKDEKLAAFWGDLSEESKYYRPTRRLGGQFFSRPFGFIPAEEDDAYEIKVTPRIAIEEAVAKSLDLVEEHRKRMSFKYLIIIKEFDTSQELLALMGARAVFGWTSSEARSIFASLPYKVANMNSKDEALSAIKELKASGVIADLMIMNELGEDVTLASLHENESTSAKPFLARLINDLQSNKESSKAHESPYSK